MSSHSWCSDATYSTKPRDCAGEENMSSASIQHTATYVLWFYPGPTKMTGVSGISGGAPDHHHTAITTITITAFTTALIVLQDSF